MSLEQVDSIAQGRVWTGRKALELGLVDGIGDLQNAVTHAAELAQIDHFDTEVIQQELSPQDLFIQEMFASAAVYIPNSLTQTTMLQRLIGEFSSVAETLQTFDDPNGVYLYCDTCTD